MGHSPTSILQRKKCFCIDENIACHNNTTFQSVFNCFLFYRNFQKYQLSHIRGGKSHIQKSLAVWKPELERYTGLVQQIKEKSKERKALVKLRLIGGTSVGFFQKIIDDFGLGQHKVDEEALYAQIALFKDDLKAQEGKYTNQDEAIQFRDKWADLYKEAKAARLGKKSPLWEERKQFTDTFDRLAEVLTGYNSAVIAAESKRCDALLSDIDGKNLDPQQRAVVLCNEKRMLVLAGAGSGKTLTIAGKVKYLCQEKGVSPEDILLIAFTHKSAEEMTDRISGKLGIPVSATTFHKLGLDLIREAEGKRPDVYEGLTDFCRDYFQNVITTQAGQVRCIIEFFAYYLHIPADMEQFSSLGEAYDYEKSVDLETLRSKYDQAKWIGKKEQSKKEQQRTLQDERVRSLEEVSIANFLFLNGVQYEYERPYPFPDNDPDRKPYHPDFYLPEYDIYLEHFGINREGKLPWLSAVEEEKYQEGMAWKRQVHKKNGTKLLETYSYLSSEGRLLEYLDSLLKKNGVKYKEPDFTDIFESVYEKQSDRYFSEFIKLCATFVALFKSQGHKIDDLGSLQDNGVSSQMPFFRKRNAAFKMIVRPLMEAYDAFLREKGAVDFADMINLAAENVTAGQKVHPYRYVIIDEYQDISYARYRLVKAILDQTGANLLCVGDDWQSIYRFAGSDISLFTDFERYFGRSVIMRLERTYRNSQQLIDEAGRFVLRNPYQLKKSLVSPKSLDYPISFFCYDIAPFQMLRKAIDKIISEFGKDSSILILGRNKFDFEILIGSQLFQWHRDGTLMYWDSPETPIRFLTAHKSKGLEADNVILLNFQNSTLGFPNKIADDPVLALVLAEPEDFLYAEERRLLYVALTRTKNRVFVLTDSRKPSEFFKEFKPSKSVFILNKETDIADLPCCPKCRTGYLLSRRNERTGKFFVGCSNYPKCDYVVRDVTVLTEQKVCPQCGGFLVRRRGQYGEFYGCTNYPRCSYTEQISVEKKTGN